MTDEMTSGRRCVFCDERGSLTREHVWPQWLRAYPGYAALIEQEKGVDRPDFVFGELTVNDAGEYVDIDQKRGRSPLLPEVQVKVCATCNNGWMGQLEGKVKSIVEPWIQGDDHWISEDDARTLALWVCKTAMTYGMYHPDKHNPFRPEDYAALFQTQSPIDSMAIWVGFSHEPNARIAMSLQGFWFGGAEMDFESMHEARPNVASFYMAAHCVVFFMHYWRGPERVAPIYDLPPQLRPSTRRLWPNPQKVRGPLAGIEQDQLRELIEYLTNLNENMGLPWIGNSPDGMREAYERWMAGEDARNLRREFESRER